MAVSILEGGGREGGGGGGAGKNPQANSLF